MRSDQPDEALGGDRRPRASRPEQACVNWRRFHHVPSPGGSRRLRRRIASRRDRRRGSPIGPLSPAALKPSRPADRPHGHQALREAGGGLDRGRPLAGRLLVLPVPLQQRRQLPVLLLRQAGAGGGAPPRGRHPPRRRPGREQVAVPRAVAASRPTRRIAPTRRPGTLAAMEQVPVLWLTAGLSCDGDSIAMTAATQPSLEDLVLGAFPGVPRVRFHHPVLAYEVGDEFLAGFEAAAAGELGPFILVVEGSIPDETGNEEGCWAGFGTDPATGQPIPTTTWIDRLTAQAWAVMAVGTCAAYGGIHGMAGNPTGAMGLADYLGWDWRSKARAAHRQPARLPHPARQLHRDPALPACASWWGRRRRSPSTTSCRPRVAVRPDPPRELRPGRLLRAGRLRRRVRVEQVHRQARLLGAGGRLQRGQAGLDERHRRLRQRRRHLHRLHHARLPRQVPAVPRRAPGGEDVVVGGPALRTLGAGPAQRHPGVDERRARVAGPPAQGTAAAPPTREPHRQGERHLPPRRQDVGPDHPHRRQPRHPRPHRLPRPPGACAATARRRSSGATACSCGARTPATPTRSPAASAASAATTTPPPPSTPSRWPTGSSPRTWPSGSSTWPRRPSTCSTTTSTRRTWWGWTSAPAWWGRPTPASWPGPRSPRRPTPPTTATAPSPTSCGPSTPWRAPSTWRRSR